jgi:hypothetical protein
VNCLDKALSKVYVIDVSKMGEIAVKRWIIRAQKEIIKNEHQS